MLLRISILACLVTSFVWFNLFQDSSAAAVSQRIADLIDGRPARSILIVGNSRTFYNDMPAMLRDIADSAGSPTKFEVETSAYPAATFKTHWDKPRTVNLLAAGWDDVVLQPDGAVGACRPCNEEFLEYGPKLAAAAKVRQGRPLLVVGWAYAPSAYEEAEFRDYRFGRPDHLSLMKSTHARLASDANLSRINVAGPWESVRLSHPSIQLTSDATHPTLAGTYLYALAVYAALSNGSVAGVTYVPDGLSEEDARVLRDAVDSGP